MDKAIKFYSLPNDTCSSRDENGNLHKIGKHYREFYEKVRDGKNGAEALTEMGIMRTCCRVKFLCLAVEPMIDRSSNRFMNLISKPNTGYGTRDLKPKNPPPNFPSLI